MNGREFSRQLRSGIHRLVRFVGTHLAGNVRFSDSRVAATTNHLLDTKYFALHAALLPETALTRRCEHV